VRRLVPLALLSGGLLLNAHPAWAERLPFRSYGSNEGLAGEHVRFVVQDSRGFLWLATNAGVSSFDGHEFRNYGPAEGLPYPSARKVVEAPDGSLYVLARERVARARPSTRSGTLAFEPLSSPELSAWVGDAFDVAIAPDGAVVIAGSRGAARLIASNGRERFERIDLGPAPGGPGEQNELVWAVAFDGKRDLWAVRRLGITRIGRDGRPRTLPLPRGQQIESGWAWLPSMVGDRSGRVWLLTTGGGIWRLEASATGDPAVAQVLDRRSGFPSDYPRGLNEAADGTLWIGTTDRGLVSCAAGSAGQDCAAIESAEGLPDVEAYGVTTDSQGNVWAGTLVAGIAKLAADGLTSWREAEGLRPPAVWALQEDPDGSVLIIRGDLRSTSLRDERHAVSWQVPPALARAGGWGVQQLLARGPDGGLWLATAGGVAVYPPGTRTFDLAARDPGRLITTADGLPGNGIHRIFAARDGAIWIGVLYEGRGTCRIGGNGEDIRCFGPAEGLPEGATGVAFEEDAAGDIWVGLYQGGVYRYRAGRFETWPEVAAERQTMTWSIRRDAAGSLWVAGVPGLLRIEGAESDRPSFRRYTTADGVSAFETMATAEDAFGRLYVASQHGLDCIDVASAAVRTYTTADGLPSNRVGALYRDRNGTLWIGTSHGVARLVPGPPRTETPPRVYLTGMSVEGTRRDAIAAPGNVPDRGATARVGTDREEHATDRPLLLASNERTVEFTFTSPSFRAGETIRFQWRLIGASDAWSSPGTMRTITCTGLAPGLYRFEVRAVDGEGLISTPATAAFTIRPPLWRRGWFLSLMALALVGAVVAVYRARVARILKIERVRSRIATDLHDDIGASLSQIAVLSQVANRQAARGAEAGTALTRITELSGGLVDAMSDVVWSVNPARDHMSDLVHRMHRFAVDLFSETEMQLRLDLPGDTAGDERLDPESRREVYLVFKEALRNAVRHSAATSVEVQLTREGDGLLLAVRDDGRGIGDNASARGGQGLESMQRRADAIGGALEVRPRPGGGTEVLLRTSGKIRRRRRLVRWTGPGADRPS